MDEGIAPSMPDSWKGHGRLKIFKSSVIPESAEQKAIEKMKQIADKNDCTPERAANALISKIQEKRKD